MNDTPVLHETLIMLTSDIVSAHVGNNSVSLEDVPNIISNIYNTLASLGGPADVKDVAPVPAVSIRASVKNDYIVCLEDGKKVKLLKRYLATAYNLTPEQYRARWNLPADYPMVAPMYSERRRELAKAAGLGRKPGQKVVSKRARKPGARKA